MTRESHYEEKSISYGIAHTRLRRVMQLVGDIKGKQVLDIGCARGYLGARIKAIGNYVAGMELSERAAEQARQVLDKVVVFDLEKGWPEELANEKFDLIIMAEVLEHVFDPVVVLKNVHRALNDGGHIIITTPNFMVWTHRIKFLFGKFAYTDQGALDFGHIRFFTYPYLRKILEKSGFVLEIEKHIIFPGKLTRILKRWPGIFANQFILRARKI